MRLHPFRALRPPADRAAEVSSPPYDVMSADEARAMAQGRPDSFLHVIRPEIDLPAGTDPHADAVYAKAASNLAALRDRGALVVDAGPALWLYRQVMDGRAQTGFVGAAEVADYDAGRIKKHEHTRPVKEDDRTRHVDTTGINAGPVFLTCRAPEALLAVQRRLAAGPPDVDFVAGDGVRHTQWRIADPADLAAVAAAFEPVDAFYVADGHHRAASASRVRALRRSREPDAPTDAPFERFLVVVFPDTDLQIMDYNRVVADLAGHTAASFLEALARDFHVGPPGASARPERRHRFGVYVDGAWRRLTLRDGCVDESDPVRSLDVAVLQDRILGPILGIGDPRHDERIDFVGGIRGTDELARRVDAQGGGCAFAMFPTSIAELLAVADAGHVMPPKSTWFEPKLRSGLLVHLLDGTPEAGEAS